MSRTGPNFEHQRGNGRSMAIPAAQVIDNLTRQYHQAESQRVLMVSTIHRLVRKYGEKVRDDEAATVHRVTITDAEGKELVPEGTGDDLLISLQPDQSLPGVHIDVIENHDSGDVEAEIVPPQPEIARLMPA